mmetsp:Transcript_96569/g.288262  ORF Transcript_96569/g.288262 Transcript_96569/m.288262 type:complete len:216 (-) Transcript_96569:43-690(-)
MYRVSSSLPTAVRPGCLQSLNPRTAPLAGPSGTSRGQHRLAAPAYCRAARWTRTAARRIRRATTSSIGRAWAARSRRRSTSGWSPASRPTAARSTSSRSRRLPRPPGTAQRAWTPRWWRRCTEPQAASEAHWARCDCGQDAGRSSEVGPRTQGDGRRLALASFLLPCLAASRVSAIACTAAAGSTSPGYHSCFHKQSAARAPLHSTSSSQGAALL